MKRSIEDTSIVMVGAGNLATQLARAFYRKGFRIVQVFSRTEEAASALALEVEAAWTANIADLVGDAQLYVVALTDEVLPSLVSRLVAGRESGVWVHTAGSLPVDVWAGHVSRYGVFYPMQTFSKRHEVDFSQIPVFVEGSNAEVTAFIHAVASAVSEQVYEASSEQRRYLHLAAVLACNFTNHLYSLASDLLTRHGLPFEALLPLIDETARKVHFLTPCAAQTGPAVRGDQAVMERHLSLLAADPDLQELYRRMSAGIARERDLNAGKDALRTQER